MPMGWLGAPHHSTADSIEQAKRSDGARYGKDLSELQRPHAYRLAPSPDCTSRQGRRTSSLDVGTQSIRFLAMRIPPAAHARMSGYVNRLPDELHAS